MVKISIETTEEGLHTEMDGSSIEIIRALSAALWSAAREFARIAGAGENAAEFLIKAALEMARCIEPEEVKTHEEE